MQVSIRDEKEGYLWRGELSIIPQTGNIWFMTTKEYVVTLVYFRKIKDDEPVDIFIKVESID